MHLTVSRQAPPVNVHQSRSYCQWYHSPHDFLYYSIFRSTLYGVLVNCPWPLSPVKCRQVSTEGRHAHGEIILLPPLLYFSFSLIQNPNLLSYWVNDQINLTFFDKMKKKSMQKHIQGNKTAHLHYYYSFNICLSIPVANKHQYAL